MRRQHIKKDIKEHYLPEIYTKNTQVRYCERDEDDQMIKGHIKKNAFSKYEYAKPQQN